MSVLRRAGDPTVKFPNTGERGTKKLAWIGNEKRACAGRASSALAELKCRFRFPICRAKDARFDAGFGLVLLEKLARGPQMWDKIVTRPRPVASGVEALLS